MIREQRDEPLSHRPCRTQNADFDLRHIRDPKKNADVGLLNQRRRCSARDPTVDFSS
jgi:hypothetical protein